MDNILIINQYASNPRTGYGGRSFYLAKALAKSKKVCLVCGSFNHNLRNVEHQTSYIDTSNSNAFQFKSLKLFKYSSSKSFLRIINWFIFLIKICFLTKKGIGFRPSVIIFSSPALIGYMGAYFLAKRFSCDIYFEVRDIWPLSIIELGGVSKNNPFIIFLRQIEKFAYKTATGVISNLKDIQKHIEKYSIKVKRFHYLPNGIEENFYSTKKTKISDASKIILKDLNEFNDSGKTIIGYVGGLAPANAVDLMVETAFHAKKDKNLIFVVVGNGHTKQDLIKKCMKLELDNVKFYSSVVKNEVPFILQSIDILFNAMHFKELYSYGTSPIKIPEYIQSKKPIINVTNSFSLLDELDCWETIRKYDPLEVIKSTYKLKNLKPDEKNAIGEKAKLLLEKKYNYNYLSNSLLMFIESTKK